VRALVTVDDRIRIDSYLEGKAPNGIADDVREGFARPLKELPPKYFYDERGSELFERITELPEYYPTRAERSILERDAESLVDGAEELVELGSGSASKTRTLLDAMESAGSLRRYVPLDVSESVLRRSAEELVDRYDGLEVHGVVGDLDHDLARVPEGRSRLVAFLGGTIGNFHPGPRAHFLERVRGLLRPGDRFLLGTDLVKDADTLEAAYNDSEGVTAEFNLNVLRVLNRELDADFDADAFEHIARWDADNSWIEMRLRAHGDQHVHIDAAGIDVDLADGEEIRTEISTKFTRGGLESELADADMRLESFRTDPDGLFGLSLAAPL
jgi:L-histidine Nalpha-methyltransferase